MTNYFSEAVTKTLSLEGGLSNDTFDSGGITKFGISKTQYPKLDIANLTIEQAREIYLRDYWESNNCGEITNISIASQVFDIAVNGGLSVVQKAINSLLPVGVKIAEDGIIGKTTLSYLNSLPVHALNNKIITYRLRRFGKICNSNPTQLCFLDNWIVRAMTFII